MHAAALPRVMRARAVGASALSRTLLAPSSTSSFSSPGAAFRLANASSAQIDITSRRQWSIASTRAYATSNTTPPPRPPTSDNENQDKSSGAEQKEDEQPLFTARPSFNLDTTSAPNLLGAGSKKTGGGAGQEGGEEGDPSAKRPTAEQTGRGVLRFVWPILMGAIGYGAYTFGQPLTEEEQLLYRDNPLAESWFGRLRLRTFAKQSELSSPVSDILLPPQDPRIARPYTLVVELDDLLVHSEWDRQRGWRIAKRPGLDYFLGYLSTFFEIIVFTSSPQFGSEPILQKLDQDSRYIFQRLYKEHCRFIDGELVKDLSYLNRDLSKTIVLDTDRSRFRLQPENGFVVKAWNGDITDRELFGWVQLLESVFIWTFPDVRQFVKAYEGVEDVPGEFRKRLEAHRQAELGQMQAAAKQRRRFGFGATNITGQGARSSPNKTYYETQSELYHKMYIEDEANWQGIKDSWRKQNEEMETKRWEKFVAENGQPTVWDMIQVQMGMRPPFELPEITPEELEALKKADAAKAAEAGVTSPKAAA
ncbi:mitochondrial inner membrane protein required for protein import [Tilletia horrida]|nr:mitochondrial inner membrane protein required for protein import [Tilletia horrida]